jgi:riboflavin synthase
MFTGIIETLGKVKAVRKTAAGMTLSVELGNFAQTSKIGDSISVNGVCLTISKLSGTAADFDISSETLVRSTVSKLTTGAIVNIELSMKADGRFGGHFVLGHVDGTGKIKDIRKKGDFYDVVFSVSKELFDEIVVKGSVAVDGISLTVAAMDRDCFTVAVIPVTWEKTNMAGLKIGDSVNIETDIIVKAIKKQISLLVEPGKGLTVEKLTEMGF